MTTQAADWLAELCDPDNNAAGGLLTKPWSLLLDGERWRAATDGRVLVCLRDANDAAEADTPTVNRLVGVMSAFGGAAPLGTWEAAALREWCGPPERPTEEECPDCRNEPRCPYCGKPCGCGECGQMGEVTVYPDVRPGVIDGVALDRNRLARALERLEGPCAVTVSRAAEHGPMLRFAGPGWTVYLMSLDAAGAGAPVWPLAPAAKAQGE